MTADPQDAARLIAFGLRPTKKPVRDAQYAELVRRYRGDDTFADLVNNIAIGLDLIVLDVDERHGLVTTAAEESVFAVKMTDYAKRTSSEGKAHERVLHALAHLGAATQAFPRPDDLGNPAYVGRVTVAGVEAFVREAARRLAEKAQEDDDADADPPPDRPDLEAAWRVYQRRAQNPSSGDGRRLPSSTTGMVNRALMFLVEQGMLTRDKDTSTFRTTSRYRVQVLEAGARMFDELVTLGIAEITDGTGTLTVVPVTWTAADVARL